MSEFPARPIIKFKNCLILRNHELIKDDLWISGSTIIDPESFFFNVKVFPDEVIDCEGAIICPGFIDVQINGGFGVDFSYFDDTEFGIRKVAKEILAHGVTSFCPTLVSSKANVYHRVLPDLKRKLGGIDGAESLGAHVEGPFISPEKKGAHEPSALNCSFREGMDAVKKMYKHLDCISIITLAPELENALPIIRDMSELGIIVSVGHSMASIAEGEEAVRNGASFITHLFNAMLPFHHRDPGLVGLLASDQISESNPLFYGIIADGNHTHPSTTRIAYRAYPKGIVLVTDACSAMGLTDGIHHIGELAIEVQGSKAYIQGTTTLAGSVATMISCIHYFWKTTSCTLVEALEAATLHPAKLMRIDKKKGTLEFGSDADLVILKPASLQVLSTWIAGQCVYKNPHVSE